MKTLYLIRHAKSSWKFDFTDINRPLSERGKNDANLLSNELLTTDFNPQAIFSSPAKRALSTCEIFMNSLNLSSSLLTIHKELYDFDGRNVLNFIHNVDAELDTILIFGHNHAFTSIANTLGSQYIDNVPTCGFVQIQFEVDNWKNIDKGYTKMTLFPRDLKS